MESIEKLKYGCFPSTNIYHAVIKVGRDWYANMVGQKVKIVRFGSMGCYTSEHRYIDFYDLDFSGK